MGCYFNNGLKIETEYYFVHNLINESCATSVINSALSHFYFHTVLHLRQHGEKKAKVIIGHLLNLAVYLVLRDPVTWSQGAVIHKWSRDLAVASSGERSVCDGFVR